MHNEFHLCWRVLRRYRKLRYDPGARLFLCQIPHGTIFWDDEHPGGEMPCALDVTCHARCLKTLNQLIIVRDILWHEGHLPEEHRAFWEKARKKIPRWPGWRRLVLSAEQHRARLHCQEEAVEMFSALFNLGGQVQTEEMPDGSTMYSTTVPVNPPDKQA